jgi:hypothetical protein
MGAALHLVDLVFRDACDNRSYLIVITRYSCGPANVLTLSCKDRPPCRPPRAARRLPRLTRSAGSDLQPT